MTQRVGIEVSKAVAIAAQLANVDVVAAYPITPQTHIVEDLSEMVASGELDASYIPVESEHSAMSCCLGSASVGARTFTATASQGLELMHEVLYVASSMRFPIVMAVANRALSAPISIWGDHSDVMSVRDTGWIQIFVANGQEAFDNVLCSFRMAEDRGVLLPVMIHLDGFQLTHVIEPIYLEDQDKVEEFLPDNDYPITLDPDNPVSMGAFGPPDIYTEIKKAQNVVLESSKKTILKAWKEFGDIFGRYYSPLNCYRCENAKVILLAMGSFSETAMSAVDAMREDGHKVGLIQLMLWRPFPFEEIRQAVKDIDVLVVFDRAVSFGGPGGPVCSEIRSALYDLEKRPKVIGFVGGLGGRVVSTPGFREIIERGMKVAREGSEQEFEMYGVRE
ncbi:MAG: transketolase C-terminal domain-containing protein [Dehalococcoidales bacterium]